MATNLTSSLGVYRIVTGFLGVAFIAMGASNYCQPGTLNEAASTGPLEGAVPAPLGTGRQEQKRFTALRP